MKIAGIILSILFLTLNAVPCCWDSCSQEEPVEEHSGDEQSCSPFLSCGNCTGFILQQELPEITPYTKPLKSKTGFPENPFFSDFSENHLAASQNK